MKNCNNREDNYYKKLTIPNAITVFRMIASVGLCTYIATHGITSPLWVTLSALGIGMSDAVDGFLARKCGMSSQLGGILDPIADKIYNWGIGLTLIASGIMPLWPLIIAVRDATVFSLSSYQFKKNGIEMKPTVPAKLKMVFQSAGVISTLAFGFGGNGASLIAPICMSAAIATAIPEAVCIKKKFFTNKEEAKNEPLFDYNTDHEEKIDNPQEKSKHSELAMLPPNLSYPNIDDKENNLSKPKIKKKTLFKN